VQAVALSELYDCAGALLPMGVGSGKTLVTFLAPRVLDSQRPLLLVPAKLVDKTEREHEKLQRDWLLPPLRILSYEKLSRVSGADTLEAYRPDFIACDEGHRVKNPSAAVTRRVQRYIREHRPKVLVCSGTLTRKSLLDYWHLLRWTLGDEHMPLPAEWQQVTLWADALDSHGRENRTGPGALGKLFETPTMHPTLEDVRSAFRARLVATPGVVATTEQSVDASLSVELKPLAMPRELSAHIERMRDTWETPDGHPFTEAVDLWRHARELACGFYYRWNPRPPVAWLEARKAWCKAVRNTLKYSRALDSELQVVQATDAGRLPALVEVLAQWRGVRDTFKPRTEAVWLSSHALEFAAKWLAEHKQLVWCEHVEFAAELSTRTRVPYFGRGGLDVSGRSIETHNGPAILSIAANAEGRNLQRYSKNLVVSPPPSGATWEQLLGRTHRSGQEADTVEVTALVSCAEQRAGFEQALRDAAYIEATTGQSQKLRYADVY
jgi:hypothetical protein